MKKIDIIGDNFFGHSSKERVACRGIVINNNQILLSFETKTGLWMIPGGGIDIGETEEACCVRELTEETGMIVKPVKQFLVINEFYEEWHFITNYFICEIIGETRRNLTIGETRVGMEPRWILLEEAKNIFSKHQDYTNFDEEKRGLYLREYKALECLKMN
ncbi:MAG: NUDIX hydrolase [Bacilli bacterium]